MTTGEPTRRSFLRGILTVAAVSVAASPAMTAVERVIYPTLWGDLIHDDTAGLQAALDGTPFYADGALIGGGAEPTITRGYFLISDTLRIRRADTRIRGCVFFCKPNVDPMLTCETTGYIALMHSCFRPFWPQHLLAKAGA